MRSVRVTAGPETEPLSLEDVKLFLKVDTDADDSFINSLIISARTYAEGYLNRRLITQTLDEILDYWPLFPHLLRQGPFRSLESIRYYDEYQAEGLWDASNYFFDAGSGRIALTEDGDTPDATLRDMAAVRITYVSGFGSSPDEIPRPILDAMMIYVAHLYRNREPYVKGTIVSEIPFSMTALLDPFREVPI